MSQQEVILENTKSVLETTQRLEGKLDKVTANSEGFGSLMLNLLVGGSNQDEERMHWRQDFITAVLDSGNSLQPIATSGPEISDDRKQDLTKRFIARLYYPEMNDRGDRIAKAHESTFRWLFDETEKKNARWSSFRDWLISDDQLYWITGKAGSGKSTLMKYLCQPIESRSVNEDLSEPISRCTQYLKTWVGDNSLLTASFYLWNSGLDIQMTQSGLLRSLLHQIILQLPELLPLVSPRR